jgi:hypothetical protein
MSQTDILDSIQTLLASSGSCHTVLLTDTGFSPPQAAPLQRQR